MSNPEKPARKIGLGRRSLTGKIYSQKDNETHLFESSLERDFIKLQEFDINVAKYIEQPVTIEYVHDKQKRYYTPDFLVYYIKDEVSPLLCEIKYSVELKTKGKELKPRFDAAKEYAEKRGWSFQILTEKEIRNPYLENVKFLFGFLNNKNFDDSDAPLICSKIEDIRITTPDELLAELSGIEQRRAELLHTLWYLIANRTIACDLTNLLTMKTEIWHNKIM